MMKFATFNIENIGWSAAAGDEQGLCAVILPVATEELAVEAIRKEVLNYLPKVNRFDFDLQPFSALIAAIKAYYAGTKVDFDCYNINWSIFKPFQQEVLRATFAIPFGEVRSYGDIAKIIGSPGAARAVGGALRRNPIPLVIPCHRVIQSNGRLGGFSGVMNNSRKSTMLSLEGLTVKA